MKLTRKQKDVIGLSMLISAILLTVTFLVVAIRKRSIWAALAAVLAAEGVVGYWLLAEPKTRKLRKRRCQRALIPLDDEELFDEEECLEADARIRKVLGGKHGGEAAPRVLREIPRDEDATEADFQ